MLICAGGDCHGKIDMLYDLVLRLEEEVGRRVDLDRATRNRGQGGDFAQWFQEGRRAPRPTVFIAGNHEDFDFLAKGGTRGILPDLTFLAWGDVFTFRVRGEVLRIGGAGGCYGMKDYPCSTVTGPRRRHYLLKELERLASQNTPRMDILLLHDAPAGVILPTAATGTKCQQRTSQSEGLAELIATVRPRICLTGHWHVRSERTVSEVRTVGLNLVPHPGCVLFLDFPPGDGEPHDVAEWGSTLMIRPPVASVQASELRMRGEDHLSALVELVTQWAREVLGSQCLDRELRRRLHEQLEGNPYRALFMNALKNHRNATSVREGSEIWRILEQDIPFAERAAVLARWKTDGLPAAQVLRQAAGLPAPEKS